MIKKDRDSGIEKKVPNDEHLIILTPCILIFSVFSDAFFLIQRTVTLFPFVVKKLACCWTTVSTPPTSGQ